MAISYIGEGVKRPNFKYRIVSIWLKTIIKNFGFIDGDLSYIFCSDEYLKKINVKYLDHDYYTDIVTFDYCNGDIISGDLFISIDRVRENSVIFQCDLNDEFLRVMVHGLLHLLGKGDSNDTEREIMRSAENESLIIFKKICNAHIK